MIGAAARNTAVAEHQAVRTRYPMLARAIVAGASAQIRNMATVGGNLLQRTRCTYFYDTDGSRCNKRTPGDGLRRDRRLQPHARDPRRVAGLRRHASVGHVRRARRARRRRAPSQAQTGERTVALCDLHRLPGDRPEIETVLEPGELITAVELPRLPRRALDLSQGARPVQLRLCAGLGRGRARARRRRRSSDVRLALGGVAPKPWRARRAEAGAARRARDRGHVPRGGRRRARRRPPARRQRVQGRAGPAHARRRPATADRGSTLDERRDETQRAVATRRPRAGRRRQPDPLVRAKHGLIGAQVSRLDGPLKVRGEARFAAEFVMDGMVYAALALQHDRPRPHHDARHSAAEAAPGVVLVMTHRNAPRMKPPPLFLTGAQGGRRRRPAVMQDDSIHWNGQPVAVVLAETPGAGRPRRVADRGGLRVARRRARFEEARAHPRTPDSLVGQPVEVLVGDAEAALDRRAPLTSISRTGRRATTTTRSSRTP